MSETQFISGRQEAITSTHKVLRNTYLLLSMTLLFSAGMGIGLVFWSIAEPIKHYLHPPIGSGQSLASAEQAMKITFFHDSKV